MNGSGDDALSMLVFGAGPAALGAALAGSYRLEQRFVTNRRLGLLYLVSVGLIYALVRPYPWWKVPGEIRHVAAVSLLLWYGTPLAHFSAKRLDAWLQGGITLRARVAWSAGCGGILAVLFPLAAVIITDLVSGATALAALTLRLVTRVPVPVLLVAGALLRLLLPWSNAAG